MLNDLRNAATPALRFLAACSYLPGTEHGLRHQQRLLQSACSAGLCPQSLWDGIRRHRIFALADAVLRQHGLNSLLGEFQPQLAHHARRCRFESLRLLAVSTEISKVFSNCGIDYRFVKGPHLSKKIYTDPSLRHCKDLDALVQATDVKPAIEALQRQGWELRAHSGMWLRSGTYRSLAERLLRHFELFHQQKQVSLELHWRIEATYCPSLDNAWFAGLADGGSSPITGAQFLHLCLHGAVHAWMRLKWMGDIQAILDRNPSCWSEHLGLCDRFGLGLIAAQTILLVQVLFEAEPDAAAAQILDRHPQAFRLAKFALQSMQFPSVVLASREEMFSYHRYLSHLGERLPWNTRVQQSIASWLCEQSTLETWNWHPLTLPALPAMRLSGLFKRYCLNFG